MKKVLPGLYHKDEYTEAVEADILPFFEDLFEPLFAILKSSHVRENATASALKAALQSGRVWYADGVFSGEFNAAISRELRSLGATFSDSVFRLPLASVPVDLRGIVAASKAKGEALHKEILNVLDAMGANAAVAATGITFAKAVSLISTDLQRQFLSSVQSIDSESLAVPAQMSPGVEAAMREKLTYNTDIEIKNFTAQEVSELRMKVEQNLFAGGRPDRLEAMVEAEYGVTKRKARFIAENETSLAVSRFRQERYQELGSREYIWSTSHDNKVRHDHKVLDGRSFFWDTPPVVDIPSGRRRNPGEDYNCRCVARPIINLK